MRPDAACFRGFGLTSGHFSLAFHGRASRPQATPRSSEPPLRAPPFPSPGSPRPPRRARFGSPSIRGRDRLSGFPARPALRNRRASLSVIEACVSFDRFVLRKSVSPIAPRRRRLGRPIRGPKALDRRPGLRDFVRQEAVAILGERRSVENSLVDERPYEPAKQHVELQPFDKLPLRADRIEKLQQARSQQSLPRNGRTPAPFVERENLASSSPSAASVTRRIARSECFAGIPRRDVNLIRDKSD